MTHADAGPFAALLAELGEVYAEEVSPLRARLYFEALQAVPLAQVRRACGSLLQTSRFFPRPADILEAVRELAERPREMPALYPHYEPVDPALFRRLLKEMTAKLSARDAS